MRVIVISQQEAHALSDGVRIQILRLLQNKSNTVDYVCKKLDNAKAHTTIRHHFKILVEAGLLKKTKMTPIKGAFLKYYKSTVTIEEPTS